MTPLRVRHLLAAIAGVSPDAGATCFIFARVDAVDEIAGAILPPAERQRIDALASPGERARRAAAHRLKRLMLGRLLGEDPAAIACAGGGSRPPEVAGRPEIALTLSHAGAWVAAGVGWCGRLGVDVEQRREVAWEAVFQTAASAGVPLPAATDDPTADWCRLEAAVKLNRGWAAMPPAPTGPVAAVELDAGHVGAAAWTAGRPPRVCVVA